MLYANKNRTFIAFLSIEIYSSVFAQNCANWWNILYGINHKISVGIYRQIIIGRSDLCSLPLCIISQTSIDYFSVSNNEQTTEKSRLKCMIFLRCRRSNVIYGVSLSVHTVTSLVNLLSYCGSNVNSTPNLCFLKIITI